VFQSVLENRSLTNTIVLLLAAILLFIAVSLLTSPLQKKTIRLPLHRKKKDDPGRSDIDEQSQIYCHQCGKRAKPGDLFCRVCGSKLIQG
jgi:hypothetical protein